MTTARSKVIAIQPAALGIRDAARYCGCTEGALNQAVARGMLGYVEHPGGRKAFRIEQLNTYLAQCERHREDY